MREVRYVRWKAILSVCIGAFVILCGLALCIEFDSFMPSIIVLLGAVRAYTGNLRVREKDVLLRFTPQEIWTKEFGWQAWSNLEVVLEEAGQGYTIEIRRTGHYTPRFLEYVSNLTIDAHELKKWIQQFAVPLV